jgi:hypothetical protein
VAKPARSWSFVCVRAKQAVGREQAVMIAEDRSSGQSQEQLVAIAYE